MHTQIVPILSPWNLDAIHPKGGRAKKVLVWHWTMALQGHFYMIRFRWLHTTKRIFSEPCHQHLLLLRFTRSEVHSCWPSICASSPSPSPLMLQWESRPDRAFPGKTLISHTRVTFLHASGNSIPKQGTFLFLAIGKRSIDRGRF